MSAFVTTLRLPGVVQVNGPFSPPGYGDILTTADDVYLDLGPGGDFPPETGPNVGFPIGDGTIYQMAASPMSAAISRAWALHGWRTLQFAGTLRIASQQFVGAAGSVAAVYRTNPPDPTLPVGGIAEFVIPPITFPDEPISIRTTGQQKWSQFHDQTAPGRAIFYDADWPGINRTGNIDTTAKIDGFDLDWIMPVDRLGSPPLTPPVSPSSYGHEIYRQGVGDYNFYLGSDVTSWDGSPGSIPTPSSIPFDLVLRMSAYGNCGIVRRKDLSGVWQYPVITAFILSASIEQNTVDPTSGYFGSPPITPDTDGYRATEAGLLTCSSILTSGTFVGSGIGARFDIPGGSFIGDVNSHNYSDSFIPDPTAGDNGWSANAIPWKSTASDFVLHFRDPVFWGDAPPL